MKCRGDRAGKVLAVGGLPSEARIAAGPGVRAIAGGGDGLALGAAIEREIATGARALLSFGIAGALDPTLVTGALIVARSVWSARASPLLADTRWSQTLLRLLPDAIEGELAGSDGIVDSAAAKAAWRARSGALAVDMESHIVAAIASRHGLPFVALRAVADTADRHVPHAATVAMRAGGGVDLLAVLASLARGPAQLGDLFRLAGDSRRALRALLHGRQRLGDSLGYADLDELALHVV